MLGILMMATETVMKELQVGVTKMFKTITEPMVCSFIHLIMK